MIPISEISQDIVSKIKLVLCDIDDTISTEGKILPEAYNALWKLKRAGFHVVPITGRCAGWVDHIARMWPVSGVIGENGAFYAYMDISSDHKKLKKRYYLQPDEVKEAQKKFEDIKKEVFSLFPQVKVASDQPYRQFDLAIDFCEDVPPLERKDVLKIVNIFENYGAQTKISSIHVNGWFGDYDKLTMTKIFSKEQLKIDLEKTPEKALFIGDSPNDQPMFNFFPISVGVQNINNFKDLINNFPTYVTKKPAGLGFAEIVKIIIEKTSLADP
ncbi:MAG: HAD-IIB family hydrolase [Candidatus Lokiarchaeota archaeon]|nr:HAD-IIB family hydrolase [Candidatus Lokiarchaeota archaeon]